MDESRARRFRLRRPGSRWMALARRVDGEPHLVAAVRLLRRRLPGDARFGDPLSTAGAKQVQLAGRRLSELSDAPPGALREAGLSALQVWQAISEAQGRGRGSRRLAIVFTDLVDFSDWALAAGDSESVRVLRELDRAMTTAVTGEGGRVVKRLGDGMMAVFGEAPAALAALREAVAAIDDVECGAYVARFRAGLHVGTPRELGGDYFGVDVTLAARLAEEAGPGEVLISDAALAVLDGAGPPVGARRRRRFKVKGVAKDVAAHAITLERPEGVRRSA